jgi:integrase
MARKVGQIVGRGRNTWIVRVYNGRNPETKKRNYLNQTIHGGLRDAQAHLNRMLGERDRGRNLDSSKQTLNQYLDRWLEVCAKPRLRAKSLQDYAGLLRRYVRPQLGTRTLPIVSAFDIQTLYRELLDRGLSARSIRYTHAVLRSALKQAVRWSLILANPADWVDLVMSKNCMRCYNPVCRSRSSPTSTTIEWKLHERLLSASAEPRASGDEDENRERAVYIVRLSAGSAVWCRDYDVAFVR